MTTLKQQLDWLIKRPIAHRGLHQKSEGVIENTHSAFAAAIQHNYAIECDLQITADEEAVIFHDETLDRLCDESGLLKERTTKQLQQVRFKACSDRIQTLGEFLDQVAGRVTLVIELKSHWDGNDALLRRTLKVLEAYEGPYALMSFDPEIVESMRHLSPHTVRGITADNGTDEYYNFLPEARRFELQTMSHLSQTQPHFASFYFKHLPFAPIHAMREAGHPIVTWTIRSREQELIANQYGDQVTFEGYIAT
jgi:glycerophosphoryl diester phosphodiesterase